MPANAGTVGMAEAHATRRWGRVTALGSVAGGGPSLVPRTGIPAKTTRSILTREGDDLTAYLLLGRTPYSTGNSYWARAFG